MQLAGLLLAFTVILVLAGRRVELGTSVLTGTVILAVLSRMKPGEILSATGAALIDPQTVDLIAGVAVITALAEVLRRYGLLADLVYSVTRLLGGPRQAIMAVPSIIGALPVVGGAILSAPMVDGLGRQLSLSPARKAAVNLLYRHAWYFIAPFTPSLILAAQMSAIPLGTLILWQMPIAVVILVGGYLSLLRKAESNEGADARDGTPAAEVAVGDCSAEVGERSGETETRRSLLAVLFRSGLPIAAGIVFCLGLGPLTLPLSAAMGIGLVLALFSSRGHPDFQAMGLLTAWRGIQWKTVYAMAAVMIFSRLLSASGAAAALVEALMASRLPLWLLLVALPAGIGVVVGIPTVSVGIAFPTLLPMVNPANLAPAAAVLYCSGFIAYLVSPVHLCQVLTTRFFGVALSDLYRQYRAVMAGLAVTLALYVWWVVR